MNEARESSGEPAAAPEPTVLVVEDEVLIRMAISDYLRECGYRVVEAGSGEEAIQVLQAGVTVDVVFSDIHMPGGVDGFGLAQWMRRERPGVKVILTSGVARSAKEAGHLCEDSPLIAKPYDHGNLELRIRQLLGRQISS